MRYLFILILIFSLIIGYSQKSDDHCKGFFRWNVKTLTDTLGMKILDQTPMDISIEELIAEEPPVKFFVLSRKDGKVARQTTEMELVRVKALVTDMKIEGDHDYHIVLKSLHSKASLIAEIPDPDCPYLNNFPEQRLKFRVSRQQGDSIYQLLKTGKKPVPVVVTGVAFWDAPHFWIKGSSPNGREIHPVIEIRELVSW